jgi:hypothetical protein
MLICTGGCVTPLTLQEQAPDIAYVIFEPILVSIIDERHHKRRGIEPDIVGMEFHEFGLPRYMRVYPMLEVGFAKQHKTLVDLLEEPLVFGMNESGWDAQPIRFQAIPSNEEVAEALSTSNTGKFLLIVLYDWYVSVNKAWFSDSNFDWDLAVIIFNKGGNRILEWRTGARTMIPYVASDSYPNTIKRAFRDRLDELMETEQVREALLAGTQAQ